MKAKPFTICEISGNHNGKLSNLLFLIKKAKQIGASAVKIQTFKPEKMALTSNKEFIIKSKNSEWNNKNLYNIYRKTSVPYGWHKNIFNFAKKINIQIFSSPFSKEDVVFLENFKPPFYKIASLENTNLPLLKSVAKTRRKIFLSTGTATKSELKKSINILKKFGSKKIVLLKCITDYPADPGDYNLNTLLDMKKTFKCEVGISDHTVGPTVGIASIFFGAKYFEKHLCLNNRKKADIDSFYSTTVDDFEKYIQYLNEASVCSGKVNYGNTKSELISKNRRRKIFYTQDLKSGSILKENNIYGLRALSGIGIENFEDFINKKLIKNVNKNTLLKRKHIFDEKR
tara:strand:- start:13492 stop:14520 length:1029 start_codon:yes stop_codon:yes gene_type:complete